jgi:hypothetical protein
MISAIPRIKYAVRLALRRSAKALRESCEASTDKLTREEDRSDITLKASVDLSAVALHTLGHHEDCRDEVCSPAEDIPPGLLTAFETAWGDVTTNDVPQVVAALCERWPELTRKKVTVIQHVRGALAQTSAPSSIILLHAFGDHTQCSESCSLRPTELCDLAQEQLVGQTSFLVGKTPELVDNMDTNVAESFGNVSNMLHGGRRTNIQGRGGGLRKTTLAGLTMARGYLWHEAALRKMGLRSSPRLNNYAEYVNQRRKKSKECPKRRARQFAGADKLAKIAAGKAAKKGKIAEAAAAKSVGNYKEERAKRILRHFGRNDGRIEDTASGTDGTHRRRHGKGVP